MSETPSSPLLSTTQLRGHYAGFVSRTHAFVIDLIIMTFIQIAFVLAISLDFNFLRLSSFIEVLRQTTRVGSRITALFVLLITRIVTLLGSIFSLGLYEAISWPLIGRTLGQAFLGLRVMGANGQNLKFRRSARRAIGYLPAVIPLIVGFVGC